MSGPSVDWGSPHYRVQYRSRSRQIVDVTDRVITFNYNDNGGRSTSTLELEFDNSDDWAIAQRWLMGKGQILRAGFGYPGLWRNLGEWITKEHKGDSNSITVTLYPRKRSRCARKMVSRVWHDTTRSQVVRELLQAHGWSASEINIEETKTRYKTITQSGENDWTFCQRLADSQGFWFWSDEKGVYWLKPQTTKRPSHWFRRVRNVVGVGFIIDYSIDGFGAGIPGRVVLKGRDPHTKREFTVVGTSTDDGAAALAGLATGAASPAARAAELPPAPADPDAAPAAVPPAGVGAESRAADDEIVLPPAVLTSDEVAPLSSTGDLPTPAEGDAEGGDSGFEIIEAVGSRSEAEARKLAAAIYQRYRYSAMKLTLEIFGDPTVRSNRTILIWGLGPALDGIWRAKSVKHDVAGFYRASLELRRGGVKKKTKKKTKAQTREAAIKGLVGEAAQPTTRRVVPGGRGSV